MLTPGHQIKAQVELNNILDDFNPNYPEVENFHGYEPTQELLNFHLDSIAT